MTPYLVTEFQDTTLSALIRECFGYDFLDIFEKNQVKYIYNYLKSLDAATILLEPRYTDRDFLEDYSRYYVKRFKNDGQVCGRLHFFSCKLNHNALDNLMLGKDSDLSQEHLQAHYLGFVVIKPLSKTFIGKTCLRAKDGEAECPDTKRITKRYDVSLFGIDLHVASIAFQEQDKVVAACATTAIWTALHALPGRDVRQIPSCSEITIAALNYVDGSSNGFPNKGLSHKQIQRSLDVEGLRYHSSTLTKQTLDWFLNLVRAHNDSSLPLILAGTVYGPTSNSKEDEELQAVIQELLLDEVPPASEADSEDTTSPDPSCGVEGDDPSSLFLKGQHAITVVGYDFRDDRPRLYVHDDRLGPYARAELIDAQSFLNLQAENGVPVPEEIQKFLCTRWALAFSHRDENGIWLPPYEILVPDLSIVPADKKARLPFQYAYGTAITIEDQIRVWMEAICENSELTSEPLRFSIKLSTIGQLRESVLGQSVGYKPGDDLPAGYATPMATAAMIERWENEKLSFLTNPMARLQWDIDFYWGDRKVFKVLLDATDIPLGDAISAIYIHDLLYAEIFLQDLKEQKTNASYVDEEQFFSSFLKTLARRDEDYESHLNKTYGALRAPRYVEKTEISENGKGSNETTIHRFDPRKHDRSLAPLFKQVIAAAETKNLIWAIGREGSLYVAVDEREPKRGHPSMTGLQAARIAGEMWWRTDNQGGYWGVNHGSGRYSFDYSAPAELLQNAITKIGSFFPDDRFEPEEVRGAQPVKADS